MEVDLEMQVAAYHNLFLAHMALEEPYHARAAALCQLQAAQAY